MSLVIRFSVVTARPSRAERVSAHTLEMLQLLRRHSSTRGDLGANTGTSSFRQKGRNLAPADRLAKRDDGQKEIDGSTCVIEVTP